ncbi:AMSH-like ubiquitin thioesterase 3 isoform X2 [Magnolia sinica]|uniref:AMSH-like ubiquitin thioesterase 3 isoform X2 n=1 Tax=Magnolia sinica TaxID=86752 RepID=UPI00265B501C|nr:AMSH-like ubiquitin thioesterase 3 isoform X2 [Magnolia sinica]
MMPRAKTININASAQKVDVDNRIPLQFYYRIAENLLKQASIYREEKNLIDLYIILLRFSSLMSETIPLHRDYQVLLPKEKICFRKKLVAAIEELESLKPDVQCRVNELNKGHVAELDERERISYNSAAALEWPPVNKQIPSNPEIKQPDPCSINKPNQFLSANPVLIDKQFRKLSLNVPHPKEETLTRHSIFGPMGLWGQWPGPVTGIRVNYPSNADLTSTGISGQNQAGQYGLVEVKDDDSGRDRSTTESPLSLDALLLPTKKSCPLPNDAKWEDTVLLNNIHQPSPPPVLAYVQNDLLPISPSKVADPRPGPSRPSLDGIQDSNAYQHLYIPPKMMEDFLRMAQTNTAKNLETCGVLAGSLCQTMNEEEIFDIQDKLSLFPLGWIHTHPSQSCFMSSIDLHTHYSYQVMLPEAIAIVMAPTDTSRTHGIFHLSDPAGVTLIRNCQQRGFHPHEQPEDGSPIYEHCSHVYMHPNLNFDVVDLR